MIFSCQGISSIRVKKMPLLFTTVLSKLIQYSSVSQSCLTLWTSWSAAYQASLSITDTQSLLKVMCIESMMPSNHLILCHSLLFLPSIFPSIRVFSSESVRMRWPKNWSFSFSISPSNEYSGLISFRVDGFDLLDVQGTLKINTTGQKHQFVSTQLSSQSNSDIYT